MNVITEIATGNEVVRTPADKQKLAVYSTDLNNITGAIVTELQWRSDDHESRLAALEAWQGTLQ